MIDKVITWPETEERRALCEFSRFRFGFPNCFFIVDGTTHPLAEEPSLQDKESFFDRKSRYSVYALIASDPRKKVIGAEIGWPGCVHDARVLSTTKYMNADADSTAHLYFMNDHFGIGDAAFGVSKRLVPSVVP